MVQSSENQGVGAKPQIEEQRVKPTVIRRRAKKVEEAPPTVAKEQPVAVSEIPVATAETVEVPVKEIPQEQPKPPKEPKSLTAAEPSFIQEAREKEKKEKGEGIVKLAKPSDAERKIGVVGYIDLGTSQPVKVKEDWREKLKRGPKKRKSRAELEMEAIQRAGGLKQYAGALNDELPSEVVPVEAEVNTSWVGERVFQPGPSSRRKKVLKREFKKTKITEPKAIKKIIRMEDVITVADLSQSLGVKAGDIIKKLMSVGVMATINQHIDVEMASLIAGEHGFSVEHTAFKEEDVLVVPEAHVSVGNLSPRAPVVTVMGHVDHGKTSILDVIRKSNVAAGEAGGITQHIGAYEVSLPKGKITFLDTPGHEAFTTMRARGAQATDIVILVVAADDGIMPQTIEAIDHAKAAGVPIVIAINKIDKPEAQPDKVKQSLTEHGLVPEEWGGDTICVPTSAKTKVGIEQLLEMVLLQSEMLELKADPAIRPKGLVIEAKLDKFKGPLASVLIQEGTVKIGSFIVCGQFEGKVKAMFSAAGEAIEEAGPSKPVEILGLSGVPAAGDEFVGVSDESAARLVAEQRRMKARDKSLEKPIHVSLEDLSTMLNTSETKELNVILKADVHGSVEAVSDALVKLSTERVKLSVLHSGVGGITESDVMLASASDAVILGFNVLPDSKAKEAAERENVDVRHYRIIYEMIDEVKRAMEGLLAPEEKEVWLGRARVKEVFKISKVGTIAGCQVESGKILRNAHVRLVRDQAIVYEGKISSLKRFKDDAREVSEGMECGIGIENFNDIKVGDLIEAHIIERKAATL